MCSAPRPSRPTTNRSTTTTTPSWSRPWPTAAPRRFAEKLHQQTRADWGFPDSGENANDSDYLVREQYRSIRPAFGYPACPDHTEKQTLFELLGARDLGTDLTEHFAMTPAASVSGIYLGHEADALLHRRPASTATRSSTYAQRKKMTVQQVERWLAPNLAYDPAD